MSVGELSEAEVQRVKRLLMDMGLNEYEASALAYLMYVGETKATVLSRMSGVPSSRIYEVLDSLSKNGLIVIKPGRPTIYAPRSPEEVAGALVSAGIRALREKLRILNEQAQELVRLAGSIYLKGARAKEIRPLLRIVSVGHVSLEETRKLYRLAGEEIMILSKAFEYFPKVAEALKEAAGKGVR
ncbi:hypothetical protein DRO32_00935, partial [Candidatus Bathyarchaeota archaeon]